MSELILKRALYNIKALYSRLKATTINFFFLISSTFLVVESTSPVVEDFYCESQA